MTWSRFVALGDSLTEGVGDPLPGGLLRGWAVQLADGLRRLEPDLRFSNLALRSLTSREILERQLDPALELRPDLASVIAGMNDAIRPGFDPANVAEPLESMTAALAGAGATLLMATLPDVTRFLPLPARVTAPMHANLEAANDIVRDIASRRGAILVDARDHPEELRRSNWSLDQLHPNSRGHLLIARAFAARLAEVGGDAVELPPAAAVPLVGRENARHAGWLVSNVGVREARRLAARALGRGQLD